MWLFMIPKYMEGGGPDNGGGDPQGGSPDAPPERTPESHPNVDEIEFPEPISRDRSRQSDNGGSPDPAQPFFKRGEREFKSAEELAAYLDEQERQPPRRDFDPDAWERRWEQRQEERERRLMDQFSRHLDDRFRAIQPQEERNEWQPPENPYDQDAQPAQWARHEVENRAMALERQFQGAIDRVNEQWEKKFEEMGGSLDQLTTQYGQDRLNHTYVNRFDDSAKRMRVDPDFHDLLRDIVAYWPDTRDDLENMDQMVSMHGKRLQSIFDKKLAAARQQTEERGEHHQPSPHRGAGAPVMRRRSGTGPGYDRPGSLGGRDSTYNRLRHRLAASAEE